MQKITWDGRSSCDHLWKGQSDIAPKPTSSDLSSPVVESATPKISPLSESRSQRKLQSESECVTTNFRSNGLIYCFGNVMTLKTTHGLFTQPLAFHSLKTVHSKVLSLLLSSGLFNSLQSRPSAWASSPSPLCPASGLLTSLLALASPHFSRPSLVPAWDPSQIPHPFSLLTIREWAQKGRPLTELSESGLPGK